MIIDFHSLRLAEYLDLSRAPNDRLHLIHAGHRGAQLEVPGGWLSLWLPLRGELQLESGASHWTLPQSHLLISREADLRGVSRQAVCWLALTGSAASWNQALQQLPERALAADVFPRQWRCPRELRRLLVHMARQLRRAGNGGPQTATVHLLCATLLQQQQDLQPLVDRCNGRTPQRRRLTLLRLLRVHQLIERDGEGRLDLQQLARSANYSPWHLIRMYREVFGETPSEHATRLRLDRAWSLVRDSAMPVSEITQKLGFESQSAFCRAFKNAYGLTTTQVRLLPTAGERQPIQHPPHVRARARHSQQPLVARR